MRLKLDAILGEFAKRAKAKDLKAAAVSQDSAIPGHELMQTAKLIDERMRRAQVEMKRLLCPTLRASAGSEL